MADDDIKIHIDGETYAFDDFELGDLEWLEEHIGQPLTSATALNSMKAIVGFVYLVKRRDNPEFTLDQARKVKMAQIGDAEPAPAAKKRPTRAAA